MNVLLVLCTVVCNYRDIDIDIVIAIVVVIIPVVNIL